MGELVKGNFGWKEEPLKEGLSENKVVRLTAKETSGKDKTLSIEVHPEIIEDNIAGLQTKDRLVQIEIENWNKLIRTKSFKAILKATINSTKTDWVRYPEKYMALAIVLRMWNDETEPFVS